MTDKLIAPQLHRPSQSFFEVMTSLRQARFIFFSACGTIPPINGARLMQSAQVNQLSNNHELSAVSLKSLRISESRYRRLFETARDGILLLNADSAQIEDVNPYLIEMLGYSHVEFLGKKLWEVGPFADIAQSKEMFLEVQTNGYVRYDDLPLKTKTGKQIQVEFVSNSYDCEGIKVIQCNIRDITERKIADAKIQRHIHLYAALSQCNKAIVH
jgi:PAS domain S-box-containing protein